MEWCNVEHSIQGAILYTHTKCTHPRAYEQLCALQADSTQHRTPIQYPACSGKEGSTEHGEEIVRYIARCAEMLKGADWFSADPAGCKGNSLHRVSPQKDTKPDPPFLF